MVKMLVSEGGIKGARAAAALAHYAYHYTGSKIAPVEGYFDQQEGFSAEKPSINRMTRIETCYNISVLVQ